LLASLDSPSDIFTYAWPYAGDFSVTLVITDNKGHTASKTYDYLDQVPFSGGGGAPSGAAFAERKEEEIWVKVLRVTLQDTKEPVKIEIKMYGGVKFD
jgi:hypothetical protein